MGLFGGPKADDILHKGTAVPGRIIGIEVTYVEDSDTTRRVDAYAVEHSDGEVVGLRQRLVPDEVVRLGMDVTVRLLDGRGVIDWAATGAAQGFAGRNETYRYKSLKVPPERGIVDRASALESAKKKGEPVSIFVTAVDEHAFMFGMGTVTDLTATITLEGTEPFEAVLKRVEVAFYATHLLEAGRTLPGFVKLRRLDKPVIDWAAAAVVDPGLGQPPARPAPR